MSLRRMPIAGQPGSDNTLWSGREGDSLPVLAAVRMAHGTRATTERRHPRRRLKCRAHHCGKQSRPRFLGRGTKR
eukprot:6199978-Pleurochrysis_carterae.AAC.5